MMQLSGSGSLLLAALGICSVEALGKCGIASSLNGCAADKQYLEGLDAATARHINCMGYGGEADPCTLNIFNDPDAGMHKDPSKCKSGVLFLWDEPYTQAARGKPEWKSPDFVVQQWHDYAMRWYPQLQAMRANGLKVTTPMFTNLEGDVLQSVDTFFAKCPKCSDKNSVQYIDIIAWNAWIGSWNPTVKSGADWIKGRASTMKQNHDNRPVLLGNYAYIGPTATAESQVDVILNSGLFDQDSGIDSVYYFAAKDVGGGIPAGTNVLTAHAGASTIGQVLLKKCSGATQDEIQGEGAMSV